MQVILQSRNGVPAARGAVRVLGGGGGGGDLVMTTFRSHFLTVVSYSNEFMEPK